MNLDQEEKIIGLCGGEPKHNSSIAVVPFPSEPFFCMAVTTVPFYVHLYYIFTSDGTMSSVKSDMFRILKFYCEIRGMEFVHVGNELKLFVMTEWGAVHMFKIIPPEMHDVLEDGQSRPVKRFKKSNRIVYMG